MMSIKVLQHSVLFQCESWCKWRWLLNLPERPQYIIARWCEWMKGSHTQINLFCLSDWFSVATKNPAKLCFQTNRCSGGPVCPPWNKTLTKISTPRRRSIRPGNPNAGSARSKSETWLQEESNGTGETGRSQVNLGRTIAVRLISLLLQYRGVIWRLATDWNGVLGDDPAIPKLQTVTLMMKHSHAKLLPLQGIHLWPWLEHSKSLEEILTHSLTAMLEDTWGEVGAGVEVDVLT